MPDRISALVSILGGLLMLLLSCASWSASLTEGDKVRSSAEGIEDKVIAWRRDIHQHPELSNREVRTAALVARHLESLGFDEVRTQVGHTGVLGILKGGLPGPTVALRADMDALPVKEMVNLPFASKVRTTYRGQEVDVMHACGHDAHTAILMGAAEVLAGMREQIPGTIRFIFQPAEEGAPEGETGGAKLLIEEGVLAGPNPPTAIFGLHVAPAPAGTVSAGSGGVMAAADNFSIKIIGRQTHGGLPWLGVDPITIASQVVLALQTIPSRQLDVTKSAAVISVGAINGGVRGNIIPDDVTMIGTIRTFDKQVQKNLHERMRKVVKGIAEASGATAEVTINAVMPVTYNDPQLARTMAPVLRDLFGSAFVAGGFTMGAEDFAFYQEKIPGLFLSLGVLPVGISPEKAAPNHSPFFQVNEAELVKGVTMLSHLALAYLKQAEH
ncbi:MAG: amidohydrolase [Halioglobus sp.]|jgi:amidohydrolase